MTTSTDPFYSPKARLKRAKQHIATLHKRIEAFFKKHPYCVVVEKNADSTTDVYKFKLTRRLPESCVHSASEAIEALRSALDQTGFAASVAAGNTNPKKAAFPIADDLAGLENNITGRKVCRDIPDKIVTLFRSFKPYKGGNDLIWGLNKLRNKTHTTLITTPVITDRIRGEIFAISNRYPFLACESIFDITKNEVEFARVPSGTKLKYDLEFSCLVALGDIDIFQNYQSVAILEHIASTVEAIISATEAECRRLGFFT